MCCKGYEVVLGITSSKRFATLEKLSSKPTVTFQVLLIYDH